MPKDQVSVKDTQSQVGKEIVKERPGTASKQKFVAERFNEQLNYGGKQTQKKDEALSAYSRGPQSTTKSVVGGVTPSQTGEQRAQSSYFKKRIIDQINMMDDRQLENMSKNLNIEEKDEKASVITQDRLRKFNEIYGFEHGPATGDEEQNEEEEQDKPADLLSNPNEGDEQRDEVHSLHSKANL